MKGNYTHIKGGEVGPPPAKKCKNVKNIQHALKKKLLYKNNFSVLSIV